MKNRSYTPKTQKKEKVLKIQQVQTMEMLPVAIYIYYRNLPLEPGVSCRIRLLKVVSSPSQEVCWCRFWKKDKLP